MESPCVRWFSAYKTSETPRIPFPPRQVRSHKSRFCPQKYRLRSLQTADIHGFLVFVGKSSYIQLMTSGLNKPVCFNRALYDLLIDVVHTQYIYNRMNICRVLSLFNVFFLHFFYMFTYIIVTYVFPPTTLRTCYSWHIWKVSYETFNHIRLTRPLLSML